jgi:hypothetical protein
MTGAYLRDGARILSPPPLTPALNLPPRSIASRLPAPSRAKHPLTVLSRQCLR